LNITHLYSKVLFAKLLAIPLFHAFRGFCLSPFPSIFSAKYPQQICNRPPQFFFLLKIIIHHLPPRWRLFAHNNQILSPLNL